MFEREVTELFWVTDVDVDALGDQGRVDCGEGVLVTMPTTEGSEIYS